MRARVFFLTILVLLFALQNAFMFAVQTTIQRTQRHQVSVSVGYMKSITFAAFTATSA